MIIGIDAGGTHTKASLFDIDGNVLDTIEFESVHPLQKGYEYCGKHIAGSIVQLCEKNNVDIMEVSAGIGLAGYGQDGSIRYRIEKALSCYIPCDYTLVNDVQIAMYGALDRDDGIVIVAGTGSIAYAKKGEEQYRAGGFGYRIGDEGSAFWIGKKLLEVFSKQSDGRLEKTKLHSIVCEELQLKHDIEIVSYIEQHKKRTEIASLAKLVYLSAIANDPHALAIYDDAAKELASLANALKCHYQGAIKVSYCGGVFKSGDFIFIPLRNYIATGLEIVEPKYDSVKGAFLVRCKELHFYNK